MPDAWAGYDAWLERPYRKHYASDPPTELKWVARLYRVSGGEQEDALGPFDTEAEAQAQVADLWESYDMRCHRVEIEQEEVESDPSEPDFDSAPGGHDDY